MPAGPTPRQRAPDPILSRHPYAAEAAVIWVVVFVVGILAMGLAPPGVTWDEMFYIVYGLNHTEWYATLNRDSFSREGIEAFWRGGSEHPPLFPLAIGVMHRALAGRPTLMGPPGREPAEDAPPGDAINPIAARGAGVVEYAFLAMAVFLFTAGRWGRWAGRLAAVSLVAMPRVFAHGQVAAGDLPTALVWFLSVWAFVRALERPGIGREVLSGMTFGAALLTKINAVFIPVILVPWALMAWRRRAIRPLLITCGLGALLFVAGWPWMWIDTFHHVGGYLRRGTERQPIFVYYLGRAWRDIDVPAHYPLVMCLATVPVGVLAGAAWGAADGLRRNGRRALTALLLANLLGPLAIFGLPWVPVYDGVRLFLHVLPFAAVLGGAGGVAAMRWLARRTSSRTARWTVMAVAALQIAPTLATLPLGLSYYGGLVGGPWGASALGFEPTYWGDTMDPVLMQRLQAAVPEGSRVAVFHIPARQIFPYYESQFGRRGLVLTPYEPPGARGAPFDYLVVNCRKGYFDDPVWGLYRTGTPLVERRHPFFRGVPLCRVYDVRGWTRQPETDTP